MLFPLAHEMGVVHVHIAVRVFTQELSPNSLCRVLELTSAIVFSTLFTEIKGEMCVITDGL